MTDIASDRSPGQEEQPLAHDPRVTVASTTVAFPDGASPSSPLGSRLGVLLSLLRREARARGVWLAATGLVLLVPLIQLTAMLWAILNHTFTAPWWDEWYTAFMVKRFEQGTLTPHDIWAFHNFTHRIVIPRIVDLIVIELTHWNRQVELIVDLACGVATASIIVWCVWVTAQSRRLVLALVVPLSLLLFSMAYYDDWLLPFQLQFITTTLGVAITMAAVIRKPVGWGAWAVAIAGALIATLSSAAGLMAWCAFLPSMYKAGRGRIVAWCAAGVVTWAAYLHGFAPTGAHPSLHDLRDFVLANLGGPVAAGDFFFAEHVGLASILVLGAFLAVHWYLHRSLWHLVVWLELALFVVATAVVTGVGRTYLGGVWQALDTRYLIFPALWWVALLVIIAVTLRDLLQRVDALGRLHRLRDLPISRLVVGAGAVAALAITIGALRSDVAGFRIGIAWQDDLRASQGCVTHFETASDSCLSRWYWYKPDLVSTAAYLRAHHLANFADPNQP
jgi:hypothetical protein